MPGFSKKEVDLLSKYQQKIAQEFGEKVEAPPQPSPSPKRIVTVHYLQFKKENLPKTLSWYEKACRISEQILRIKPDQKKAAELEEQIRLCHLNTTPVGAFNFAIIAPLTVFVVVSLLGFLIFNSLFLVIYSLIISAILLGVLMKLPEFFANSWRLKASNQMVECIFYVVTYMRHTSNLELAINFAAEHLSPPLSLDLRKVMWDVETQQYSSIKESLDSYLQTWRKWNLEFIEAFHLIEGSLYEPSEDRRLSMIDKSLNVMLEETYEKMLHYSHGLKNPITMLYMLGIILPILGLVILPMVASFMTGPNVSPTMIALYIALLYNITLPIIIYYSTKMILTKRPTGYGDRDIAEENPEVRRFRNVIIKFGNSELSINPLLISLIVGGVLVFMGLTPLIIHFLDPGFDEKIGFGFLDYVINKTTNETIGPYGLGASVLSLFITLGVGLGIGLYFKMRSENVIKIRENAKKLEEEFASALFQLGNRLGDGIPAELAVGKVADVMQGTASGDFFRLVSNNIRSRGVDVRRAIFDEKIGAINYFPSNLIESSMKVLVESIKKGPLVASQALINVSEYIKEIHRVNERLRDLMADIISDMKQQISVLAPAISGIVVGITSMIMTILNKLSGQLEAISEASAAGAAEAPTGIVGLFGQGVPTYYFQIIVGVYIIQLIYVLTIMTNGIESGADKLSERYNLGKNLIRSTIIYSIIALIVMIVFNLLAQMVMQQVLTV